MKYNGYDEWVTVFETVTMEDAAMVREMLEKAKIPAILDREPAAGFVSDSAGDIVVKVPKEKAAAVARVLQSSRAGVYHD
ncbi:MAG: hypothetical protein QM368_02800 [Bacillota bacterium]|jgi:hypothetical protein|nr:hypothetical protein [Bacillota bacterium]HHU30244.1 hypothetical protein [Bacillota bacterium]